MNSEEPVNWEHADGICDIRLVRGRAITEAGYALKRMAIEKMIGLEMISAEFGGKYLLFEHRASVALDLGTTVRFCGAYEVTEAETHVAEMTPRFCLRWVTYDRRADYAAFAKAADKRAYVLHPEGISSNIRFYIRSDAAVVVASVEHAADIVEKGIAFDTADRSHPAVGGIWLTLNVANTSSQFFYVPTGVCSVALDGWVTEWEQSFANVSTLRGIESDGGSIRVSYRSSVFDWLERVPGASTIHHTSQG